MQEREETGQLEAGPEVRSYGPDLDTSSLVPQALLFSPSTAATVESTVAPSPEQTGFRLLEPGLAC
ncbi:hypothetical protein CRG98_042931 [Punica granatum]|uniref:Uncharacterized protein n=1 Tax=Punica granatum TaxID=22663 RepID=A0A2I0HY97_PUNGR|nr:hypothetical protein CRG98_042931 [Punica granatum]